MSRYGHHAPRVTERGSYKEVCPQARCAEGHTVCSLLTAVPSGAERPATMLKGIVSVSLLEQFFNGEFKIVTAVHPGVSAFGFVEGVLKAVVPYDAEGWTRRLVTGKAITISVSGKRNVGDDGNDYVAGLATKTGSQSSTTVVWTFPDGAVLTMPCVVNVTEWVAGDARAVAPLSFDLMSDGKPTFTPAA